MTAEGDLAVRYKNLKFSLNLTPSSVLIVCQVPASASLLVAPESDYTRAADSLGVSDESKIASASFNEKYVIRDPDGQAQQMLTNEVANLVESLDPFVELEWTKENYRLLKSPTSEDQVLEDLAILSEIVTKTKA